MLVVFCFIYFLFMLRLCMYFIIFLFTFLFMLLFVGQKVTKNPSLQQKINGKCIK